MKSTDEDPGSSSSSMSLTQWRPRLRAEKDLSSVAGDTSEGSAAVPRLGSIEELEEALRELRVKATLSPKTEVRPLHNGGGPKTGFLHWSDEDLPLCEHLDAADCRNVAVKLRLWNGLEPNLAIGRTATYRTVAFVVLLHAHLASVAA